MLVGFGLLGGVLAVATPVPRSGLMIALTAPNARHEEWSSPAMIKSVSAVTLATHNMSRAVAFYRMLGFEIVHGGDDAAFTSFRAGTSFLNLAAQLAERKLVLVGTCHLLPFRRRYPVCERDRGRLPTRHG